jgi:peptide/nickel transport system substrate-binding protein
MIGAARPLFVRAAAAALMWLAAVGGAHAAELRIGLSADVTSLDPHFLAAQPNLTVGRHIFDSLTHVDERARLKPGLAESWRAVDATTWEFRLRRGVRFHDGSEFTAHDAAFSLERPLTIKGSPGGYASYVRPIVAKEIVDAYTLRLKTAAPYGALPEEVNSILIVSRKAAANASTEDFDAGRALIGTGPYRFVRYARGDRVELARNDDYWEGRPAWDRVSLRILPSDPARSAALLAGDIDAIEHVPTADIARLRKHPDLRLEQAVSWRTIFLHLDQYRKAPPTVSRKGGKPLAANPFMDHRVRRAMSKAINRQALAERVMEGLAIPAANIVSPGVFGHDPALKPEPYDPEGAKKLLTEAGYAEGFAVTLTGPNNRYINDEQVLQACAQMLTRVGIRTAVEASPMSVFLARVRAADTGFALLGWGSFAADLALRSLATSPNPGKGHGTWNWARYSNPKLDLLVERALASVDPVQREALAREAGAVAMNDIALIPLHHQIVTWAMKKNLRYTPRTDEFTLAHHFKSQ